MNSIEVKLTVKLCPRKTAFRERAMFGNRI
jgi:hypothetical protein